MHIADCLATMVVVWNDCGRSRAAAQHRTGAGKRSGSVSRKEMGYIDVQEEGMYT